MKLWSETFRDGGLMPAEYAFAEIDPASRVRLAGNRNPHLAWDEVPNGTESLALFCIDPDAPADASLVNVEGQSLPLAAPPPKANWPHGSACLASPRRRKPSWWRAISHSRASRAGMCISRISPLAPRLI
jgi:phosphatidylethanolamine-binding protein (PEBP) family uncharacterized protein